jgi:hypothetical protein
MNIYSKTRQPNYVGKFQEGGAMPAEDPNAQMPAEAGAAADPMT